MAKVVVFGTKKMAELAHFYFTKDSPHEVVAFTVDGEFIDQKEFRGLPLVPFEDVIQKYPPDEYKMFIAVGYKNLNTVRAQKYYEAKEKGYELVTYLSSKITHWGDTEIGDNCFILENQVLQPFMKIGNNVTLWCGNHFGHDVVIGDHCYIASHVVVCGGVSICPYTFIGVNATIRDDTKIGRECIIGAGALILRDVDDKSVYIAKPTDKYPLDSERFEKMMNISKR